MILLVGIDIKIDRCYTMRRAIDKKSKQKAGVWLLKAERILRFGMSADSRRHVEIPVLVCLILPVYVVCMEYVTPKPTDLSAGQL
jgi:hypothetical protein